MKNPFLTLSIAVVAVCAFRFLFDGVTLKAFSVSISLPHVDPLAYGSFLAPVLGAHGYTEGRRIYNEGKLPANIDNPNGV